VYPLKFERALGRNAAVACALALLFGPLTAPAQPAPASRPIFVLNSLDASVSVLEPGSYTERERIPVGKEPHHLYLTPDEKSLLVANAVGDALTFIDPVTGKVQRTLSGVVDPYQLRFSPDMKWFVTLANRLNHVDIYRWQPDNAAEPLRLVKRVLTGKTPSHQWIDSRSSVVYATMQDSDELVAVDLETQTVRWRVPTGKLPADVYLTADDKTLFVALTGDRFVEAYDVSTGPARLLKRIPTGEGAHAFRSQGDGRHIFVSNRVSNTISIIDTQTQTVVSTLNAPGGPDCMDLLADGRTLLVSSRWARKMTVIDIVDNKILRQVPVGRSPHGVWTLDHASRR
jgi:YVTN family beta-propeller protein